MAQERDDGTGCRPLRRDAARNRELILQHAAAVFAEHGLDAGYDEIARRAGIGVGTVYRRFPERSELVRALFESRLDEVVTLAEAALGRPDPWEGLAWFLDQVLSLQVLDRGLKEVMVRAVGQDEDVTIGRDRVAPYVEQMVERAQEAGALRRDVGATDLGMHIMLMSSMTTTEEPEIWRRYLVLLLDGLRARPGNSALPMSPPGEDAMDELLRNLHGR